MSDIENPSSLSALMNLHKESRVKVRLYDYKGSIVDATVYRLTPMRDPRIMHVLYNGHIAAAAYPPLTIYGDAQ